MKRAVEIAFIIAALSSLFLAVYVGPVKAASSYTQTVFAGSIDSTIDGKWTTNNEWDDGMTSSVGTLGSAIFRDKYFIDMSGGALSVKDEYLIELFSDNTNDTGDYVQLCYDTATDGGSAPHSDDFRIDYVGHNGTIKTYVGNGTGWAPGTVNDLQMAQQLIASKLNGNNHWITEIKLEKTTNGAGINNDIFIAVYDASRPSDGIQSWPPSASVNVPDGWGLNDASALSPIPEGLGIGTVMILSSTAVIFGVIYLRRHQKS